MDQKLTPNEGYRYFRTQGLSSGLLTWLAFRRFMARPDWSQHMAGAEKDDMTGLLSHWQQQEPQAANVTLLLSSVPLLGAASGVAAMAAALNYSGVAPINIWVMLWLFALGPLLLTCLAVVSQFFRSAAVGLLRQTLLHWFSKRLQLGTQQSASHGLLMRYIGYLLQWSALLYLIAALMTFLAFATFQDFNFGWSSTLIQDASTMQQWMNLLSAPWSWWHQTASEQLVSSTRYFHGQASSAPAMAGLWWQTLMMATLVYGLLPRLMLMLWLRYRVSSSLQCDIENSSELTRLMATLHQQQSQSPLEAEPDNATLVVLPLNAAQQWLIGWHAQPNSETLKYNLGENTWSADEQWLQQFQADKPVYFVAALQQTPTAELADCIALVRARMNVAGLILMPGDYPPERAEAQLESWQFFASQHNFGLFIEEARHD